MLDAWMQLSIVFGLGGEFGVEYEGLQTQADWRCSEVTVTPPPQ
jgi:hypothetical protein